VKETKLSKFADALESGKFVVTAELNPPKGTDIDPLLEKARMLNGRVDAFNLTDSHSSLMAMAPTAVAHRLLDEGVEPILQITCRDRNRIALQSDLLGASFLGVSNLLCMTGDPPGAGDHPDAKPVFDLEAIALLKSIASLESGQDMGGAKLKGAPTFFPGAVANPGVPDLEREVRRMEEKVEAGARFFQTNAVYDPPAFERFMNVAQRFNVPILAGFIMLKSGNMARNLNANLPGVTVPDEMVREFDESSDRRETSVEIAARVIKDIRPMCQGVHIMAIGWEAQIPQVLEQAELTHAV
jgi:methylenetetrahydrofolate reductase (NADPH)